MESRLQEDFRLVDEHRLYIGSCYRSKYWEQPSKSRTLNMDCEGADWTAPPTRSNIERVEAKSRQEVSHALKLREQIEWSSNLVSSERLGPE